METVILVAHMVIAVFLIGVILIQRSEGGALGMGGGGAMGGLVSSRGAANLLTRVTTILAVLFIGTSLVLTILSGQDIEEGSILDSVPDEQIGTPAPPVDDFPSVPISP